MKRSKTGVGLLARAEVQRTTSALISGATELKTMQNVYDNVCAAATE